MAKQSGIQLNVRVSQDLYDRIRREADESGVPMTRIVRQGIEHVLEHGFQRGNPRQAAREALGIASETPPETDEAWKAARRVKDSPTEADAPAPPLPPPPDQLPGMYECATPGCEFRALSKAAICPTHGRKVQ